MRIYLAGDNGKYKILRALTGGVLNWMRIFMAGAISGNLQPMWTNVYKIICNGGIPDLAQEVNKFINENISGRNRAVDISRSNFRGGGIPNWKPYILESFYYADKDEIQKLMPYFGDFLLDSGAFTFMQNSRSCIDWDDYIERYARFINDNKVEKYFELDIDSVVGYKRVLEFRDRLEYLTGRPSIPVWHLNRGKDEYIRMCEEYDYVSIGSNSQNDKYMSWFIKTAHKHNAKVHGLGYTKMQGLPKFHFDSVDSTAWTTGNRFGYAYKFTGKGIIKIERPDGTRCPKDKVRELAVNNFIEWCKFQQWAEVHL